MMDEHEDRKHVEIEKKTTRAGLIPFIFIEEELHMMFMLPSNPKYGGDRFQIAKGKVDPGEEILEAAVREAEEELGLFKPNMNHEPVKVGKYLGRMHVYVVEVASQDMFGDPHFETGEVIWMTEKQFEEEGRILHVPVIQAAVRKITKIKEAI